MSIMRLFRSDIASSNVIHSERVVQDDRAKKSLDIARHKVGTRIYVPISIILLQDTFDMNFVKDKVNNMLRSLYEQMQDESICIVIRYNVHYKKVEFYAADSLINRTSTFISCGNEDNSCFFDVLNYIFNSIILNYLSNEISLLGVKVNTSYIDILAVGNAKDTCSITTSTEAIKYINMINHKKEVSLKYFLVDSSRIENAMKIGIRNITTFKK